MADFQFDPEKTFEQNIADFRAHVSTLDRECAEILFAKLDALLTDGDDAARARRSREQFNTAVCEALEQLTAQADEKS